MEPSSFSTVTVRFVKVSEPRAAETRMNCKLKRKSTRQVRSLNGPITTAASHEVPVEGALKGASEGLKSRAS
jgi:hypothetical protein